MSEPAPGARIDIPSLPNLRDLGGWPVPGGRVRRGVIFRSTQLDKLAGADLDAFAALGIRTVYDLRTRAEREKRPDVVPPGTAEVPVNVFGEMHGAGARLLRLVDVLGGVLGDLRASRVHDTLDMIASPSRAAGMLVGEKAAQVYRGVYRQIVARPTALAAYATVFTGIADEQRRPALFHCTTGKDRTGWGAASILLFLGVSESDVMREYLFTNRDLLPALQPVIDRLAQRGLSAEDLVPAFGVREDYLEAALGEMRERFGDIEGYVERGLGLDAETMQALRDALVVPQGAGPT